MEGLGEITMIITTIIAQLYIEILDNILIL